MTRLRLHPALLLWCSLAAFTFAFLGTSALGMGPDEPVHYVKAAASVRGELRGERVTTADVREFYPFARPQSSDPEERARARLTAKSGIYNSRFFSLPDDVAFDQLFPCFAQQRAVPASCGEITASRVRNPDRIFSYVGGYPPVPYLVSGVGSLVPGSRSDRWYGARIVGASAALLLLACAIALLCEGARRATWRLAGLALAVVPTTLFLFGVVNASAWELAGGLAVAAAVVRLSRPAPPTARTWTLIAIGAAALALSRPLGPFWLIPFAVIWCILSGWRRVGDRLRAGRAPRVAVAVVVIASLSTVLWVRLTDASQPIITSRLDNAFRLAVSDLWLVVLQIPAIFGWNDTPIATPWYWIYGLGVCGLVAVALVFAVTRERLALVTSIVVSLGAAVFIAAIPFEMYRQRYAMQARYVLPFAVIIPLLVGEILDRAAERAPRTRAADTPWYPTGTVLPALLVVFMTTVQLVGWWTNAVRNARGFGGFAFWGDGAWVPPLGWLPWAFGAAAGVGFGLSAAYRAWRLAPARSPALPESDSAPVAVAASAEP